MKRTDLRAKHVLLRLATIESSILSELPRRDRVVAQKRQPDMRDSWLKKIRKSHHSIAWNGRRFVCRRCKVCAGPTTFWRCLSKGECPGQPSFQRPTMLREEPRLWKGAAQRVVETVVPLLATLGGESGTESEPEWDPGRPLAPSNEFHASHDVRSRGAWNWCSKCGAFSRGLRPKLLRVQCMPPRQAGLYAFKRISRGLPPQAGCEEWGLAA